MIRNNPISIADVFFLTVLRKEVQGQLYCIFHPANPTVECRGALIYVHPFAEEMNKSRRMAALQARAFSAQGFCVLQIDLFGCGDSSGDFADTRWDIWKSDLAAAHRWLEARTTAPISIWGLRLGALLALDYAKEAVGTIDQLVLWQPVINGEQFLTQFLRLRLASDMLSDQQSEAKENTTGTRAMREAFARGESLEVAGYEIAPALAQAIDALDASKTCINKVPVHWMELVADLGREMPPARKRILTAWEKAGVDVTMQLVQCPPFWTTQEITASPQLIAATTAIFDRVPA